MKKFECKVVGDLVRLQLPHGDALVFICDRRLTLEQAEQIRNHVSSLLTVAPALSSPSIQPMPVKNAVQDRLINIDELERICGLQKSSIYAHSRNPDSQFPRPIRVSARMTRWSENAVQDWVRGQVARA